MIIKAEQQLGAPLDPTPLAAIEGGEMPLFWTAEKPAVPGWFWFRDLGCKVGPVIVRWAGALFDGGHRRRIYSWRAIAMGRPTGAAGVMMEMTWENLTKLSWVAQHGSESPMADTAGETILIDGTITKEDLDHFMTSHSEPPA